MINSNILGHEWLAAQTQIIPPSCLLVQLQERRVGFGLEMKGLADLIPAAVERGTFLTVPVMRQLCRAVGAQIPKRGSGLRGSVKKVDTRHDESEQHRMIAAMMGETPEADPDLLKITASLDVEN